MLKVKVLNRVPDRPFPTIPSSTRKGAYYGEAAITNGASLWDTDRTFHCLQSGTRFTHELGQEKYVKILSLGLVVYPQPSDPEAECLPLDHNA